MRNCVNESFIDVLLSTSFVGILIHSVCIQDVTMYEYTKIAKQIYSMYTLIIPPPSFKIMFIQSYVLNTTTCCWKCQTWLFSLSKNVILMLLIECNSWFNETPSCFGQNKQNGHGRC